MPRELILTGIFSLLAAAPSAIGQTAMTYQGLLRSAGTPADGNHNMTFSLFAGPADAVPVAGPLVVGGVGVDEGLFTVRLDFGASAFDGSPRWLEITVNGVTLAPRTEITAAPLAIRAGAAPWNGLSGVPAGFADGVDDAGGLTLPFSGNTSVNGPAFEVRNAIGPGIATAIRGQVNNNNDGSIGVEGFASAGSARTIGVRGQSISPNGTGVLGVTSSLTGATNGVRGESASPDGVGVAGLASAASGFNFGVRGQSDSLDGAGVHGISTAAGGIGVSGSGYLAVYGETTAPDGFGGYFSGHGFFSGNLGIGTATPSQRLEARTAVNDVDGLLVTNNDTGANAATRLWLNNNGGGDAYAIFRIPGPLYWAIGVDNSDGDSFKISRGTTLGSNDALTISTVNNVGIGLTAPAERLDVGGNVRAAGFVLAAPITRVLSLSGLVFQPIGSGTGYAKEGGRYVRGVTAGQLVDFLAPLNVPDGARIRRLEAQVLDNDAVQNVTISLLRWDAVTDALGNFGQVVSSGNSAAIQTLSSGTLNQLATNDSFAFYVRASWTVPANNLDLRLYRVSIEYEVSDTLP